MTVCTFVLMEVGEIWFIDLFEKCHGVVDVAIFVSTVEYM